MKRLLHYRNVQTIVIQNTSRAVKFKDSAESLASPFPFTTLRIQSFLYSHSHKKEISLQNGVWSLYFKVQTEPCHSTELSFDWKMRWWGRDEAKLKVKIEGIQHAITSFNHLADRLEDEINLIRWFPFIGFIPPSFT